MPLPYRSRRPSTLLLAALLATALLAGFAQPAAAQIGKGHRILMQRGLQTQGMVTKDDGFHLATYQAANYSTINWLWDSSTSQQGAAPGYPWARWVRNQSEMPDALPGTPEQPYLSQLVALQLGDEGNLNDPAVRDNTVAWFDAVRNQWPNAILYVNNYGGQVNDAALGDFITRAQPDMLSFDTYPFKNDYNTHLPSEPGYGSPTHWYAELRRYRVYALNARLPLAIYRQTFHAIQDYDHTEYRNPSPSEMNLNTYGALAFGATTFIDFTYNTGASSLFSPPGGDSNPNAAYAQQAQNNLRARNLGKALVHLIGINDHPNGANLTTDIMFLRGKTGPNAADVTPLPIGFTPDNSAPNTFSEWADHVNDPYMAGWVVTNMGTKNAGLRGDAIISWFKPLDPTLDDPSSADDQLYFMVTNGFTGPDGTAADYRQSIQINFFATVQTTIQRLNANTGAIDVVPLDVIPSSGGRRKLVVELDGGEGALFKFNTGAPFVGFPTADFNGNAQVDGGDFLAWQRGFGAAANASRAQGDGDLDMDVDAADLAMWKSAFGGAATSTLVAIPEPSARFLLSVAGAILLARSAACDGRQRDLPVFRLPRLELPTDEIDDRLMLLRAPAAHP